MSELDGLRKQLLGLMDLCKCSVCKEDVGTAVVMCTRGHGVCASCRPKLHQGCPTCSGTFLEDKPTMLVQLLERLPRVCEHSSRGCLDMSATGDHVPFCGFRLIKCPVQGEYCMWSGEARDFQNHVKLEHDLQQFCVGTTRYIKIECFKKQYGYLNQTVLCDGNIFLIVIYKDLDKRNLSLLVKRLLVGKPEYEYFFQLSFLHRNDIFHLHTLKAEVLNERNDYWDCPYQMTLHLDEVDQCLESDSDLLVDVKVIQKLRN